MDIAKSVYWGVDYGKELVVPKKEVVSLQDLIMAINILLEKERCECLRLVEY
ncbi:hypothetical protein QTL86_03515 [Cellulosilyticum sp. ST5]|uniref:hypothetical protein n=1 Tax=Cellulosilyticum sp. ST5 TaxID=3055805 RepID=UPI0039774BF9